MSRAGIGLGLLLPSGALRSVTHSDDDRLHTPNTVQTAPVSSGSRPRGMDTQPKVVLGLGLNFTIPSNSSRHLTVPSILPLPSPPLPSISSFQGRGPRSLGIRKGFVSSPPSSLPPTRYTRDPVTNPLSLANPLNSPHLDLIMVPASPAKHFRQLKRRSLTPRSLSGTAIESLGDPGAGMLSPDHIMSSVTGESSSPTMTSSPTLGASNPVMPTIPSEHHENMLATAIALSVVLGLLVLGVSTWAGVAYRRRSHRSKITTDQTSEGEEAPKQSFSSIETFSASNVVEKGLKPRPSMLSETPSTHSSATVRPTSILSAQSPCDDQDNQRRVSFIDSPTSDTLALLEHRLYAPAGAVLPSLRDSVLSTYTTLTAVDRPTSSFRDSYGLFISELDRIDEESSIKSSSTSVSVHGQHTFEAAATLDTAQLEPVDRPDSIASTDSSSGDTTYTTASARSSTSDMTTMSSLSALSSAFPETPRGSELSSMFPLPAPIPEVESPSKSTSDRKQRARSQTVANVKYADLIRTAVGRTMSLQPTKQVMTALQRLAEQEGIKAFGDLKVELAGKTTLGPGNQDLGCDGLFRFHSRIGEGSPPRAAHCFTDERGATAGDQSDFDPASSPRPGNGMKKVLFLLDSSSASPSLPLSTEGSHPFLTEESHPFQRHPSSAGPPSVTRSASFPSKLLSRRKSPSSETFVPSRRSEVLSGGYFKRALRAFRGEEVSLQGTSIPPLPPYPCIMDPRLSLAISQSRPTSALFHPDGFEMDESADTDARLRQFFAELAVRNGRDRDSLSSTISDHSEGEHDPAVHPGLEMLSARPQSQFDPSYTGEADPAIEQDDGEEEEPFEYNSSIVPRAEQGYTSPNETEHEIDIGTDSELHSDFDAYYLGLIEELDGQISFAGSADEVDVLEGGGHVPHIRVTSH